MLVPNIRQEIKKKVFSFKLKIVSLESSKKNILFSDRQRFNCSGTIKSLTMNNHWPCKLFAKTLDKIYQVPWDSYAQWSISENLRDINIYKICVENNVSLLLWPFCRLKWITSRRSYADDRKKKLDFKRFTFMLQV